MLLRMMRVVSIALLVASAGLASGQNYPYKPIRIVIPGTGGGGDIMARLIANGLAGPLGQQVVVENRPTGIIPAEIVSKAQSDGYTLLLSGSGLWLAPFLYAKLPFDPVQDFSPITLAVRQPNILVVHPSIATTVAELIAVAKAKPGALNYASGSTGAANHLAAELFKAMAGVNIVRINYKGAAAGLTAVMAGEVQVMFVTAASALPHVKTGRLRALAVTTAQPSALFPGLPTLAASGLPGYESSSVYGIFAPAGTPRAIIGRLNREIVAVLKGPEATRRLSGMGAEAVGSSPQQLATFVKADMAASGKLIRNAGIRPR